MARARPLYIAEVDLPAYGLAYLGKMFVIYRAKKLLVKYQSRLYDYQADELPIRISEDDAGQLELALAEALERLSRLCGGDHAV